ncbi:hypothetical protein MBH78_02500 [Oceanimonas sp. NS1]|nr:hypothetical protein [Oceanimonas sp. NS1]
MSALPALLAAQADKHWSHFEERAAEVLPRLDVERIERLKRLFACSDFAADSLCRQPELALELEDERDLFNGDRAGRYRPELAAMLGEVSDEATMMRLLRQFRRRELLLIAWREMLLGAEVEESFVHISALADALIVESYRWLYRRQCAELGTPTDAEGNAVPLLILGMGKLGGGELNFSSDIDLIFTFPHNGVTRGGRRELANQQFLFAWGRSWSMPQTRPP